MGTVRPWLLAGVVAPLVPVWDVGWAGLAVAASYAVLAEWTFRNEPDNSAPLALAGTGIAVGAAMSARRAVGDIDRLFSFNDLGPPASQRSRCARQR